MKKKEVFIKMAEHLLNQGSKSTENGNFSSDCLYRAPNGNKCAVGALINDEYYEEGLEGKTIDDKIVQQAVSASLESPLTKEDIDLLVDMQEAHDYDIIDDDFKSSCVKALDRVAENWFSCKLEDLVEV